MKFLPTFLFIIVLLFFCSLLLLPTVFAQDFGLSETVSSTPIAKTSIAQFIGTIIKYVLAILGVILVALIIYGGVMYATSAGNEDRVETGKKILTYAVVGIFICGLGFALTSYIIGALTGEGGLATGYGGYRTSDGVIPYQNVGYKYCKKISEGCNPTLSNWAGFGDSSTCCQPLTCDTTGTSWGQKLNPLDSVSPGICKYPN